MKPFRIQYFLVVCILVSGIVRSQELKWVDHFGSPANYGGNSRTVCDNNGEIILSGFFSGTFDFDPGPSTYTLSGSNDVFVAKYTQSNSLLWVVKIKGVSIFPSICIDSQNNIILAGPGSQSSKVYFSTQASVDSLEWSYPMNGCFSCYVTYVVKFDSNGNYLWSFHLQPNSLSSFEVNVSGNDQLFLSGTLSDTIDFSHGMGTAITIPKGKNDAVLAKYDKDGNFQWKENFGTPQKSTGFSKSATDGDGNIYLLAGLDTAINFDPVGNIVFSDTSAMILLKYDSSGKFIWGSKFRTSSVNGFVSAEIAVSTGGEVCFAGSYYGTIDFDPAAPSFTMTNTTGYPDIFFTKYSTSGQFKWAKNIRTVSTFLTGGISMNDMVLDDYGNIFFTGSYHGKGDFDPGTGTDSLFSNGGSASLYMCAFDKDGNHQWVHGMPSYGLSANVGYGVSVDNNGSVYFSGLTAGPNNDFNPGPQVDTVSTYGFSDIFLARYSSGFSPTITTPSPYNLIYPNPVSTAVFIQNAHGAQEVSIINVLGQIVYINKELNTLNNSISLDVSNLAGGVYFVTLRTDLGEIKQKIIVDR